MERKTVTSKKETNIRKKQESKTEVSDSGHIRRTKSEIFTEYVIIETELVLNNVNTRRSTEESDCFPEMVRKKVMDKEVFSRPDDCEEDFSRASDYCNVSEINDSSINREETVDTALYRSDEVLDSLKSDESGILNENDLGSVGNPKSHKENSPPKEISSNLNGSFSSTTTRSTPLKQCESGSENKGRNSESKECNNISECDESTPKNIKREASNSPSHKSGLNEVDMLEMNSIINNLAMHLSQNNDEIEKNMADSDNNVIIVNMGKKATNKEAFREKDIYGKGDSYFISSGCNEKNKDIILDRESLERSVSYLINFFENFKNRSTNKTNKTERILDSKEHAFSELTSDVSTKRDECFISNSLKSFQLNQDSNEINGKITNPQLKMETFVCQTEGKDIKAPDIQTPGLHNKEEIISNLNSICSEFCVVKYKRPHTTKENLKSDFKQIEQHRFMLSDGVQEGSNNISNTSELSFISPRFACKNIKPHFFPPVLSDDELQMPKESDGIHTNLIANSSDVSTNGNHLEMKSINGQVTTEVDKNSFVFSTPKNDNGKEKKYTSSKSNGYRARMNKRTFSITKEPEDISGYYSTDWTFSDKICFSFAVVFTMILAFYKYSFTA